MHVFGLLVGAALVSRGTAGEETSTNFAASCDIHEVTPGFRSPASTLPPLADSDWLYASADEIQEWYVKGKSECEAHLAHKPQEFTQPHSPHFGTTVPAAGQTLCRGKSALYDYTGMILWPFGPYQTCTTYSKCWFGVLACGNPKNTQIEKFSNTKIAAELNTHNLTMPMPTFGGFSVRALSLLTRVMGAEIVVPELRFLPLSLPPPSNGSQNLRTQTQTDVLVGQYHLTRTHADTKTTLELRLFELYPSALYAWTPSLRRDYGMHVVGMVLLGGTESRCRPWSSCRADMTCCGCDLRAFVSLSPSQVQVTDGLHRCPELAPDRRKPLPLCAKQDSSQPGRWIVSDIEAFTPHCDRSRPHKLFHVDKTSITNRASLDHGNHSTHDKWFEASGDPCIVNSKLPEENGRSHYFYAPYTCKYRFYSTGELHACLAQQNLTHIHVAGDSMSRDLFSFLSIYLGVARIGEAELKSMTNAADNKRIDKNFVQVRKGNLILSEGYSWDYSLKTMQLAMVKPYPDIYVTNYGLAHRNWKAPRFQQSWAETEYLFWTQQRPTQYAHVPRPKYSFYQNAKQLIGRRNTGWMGDVFAQQGAYLWANYSSMGFDLLDEHLFSMGRFDFFNPKNDGWHFTGTKKIQEVVAFFNMICNDWHRQQNGQQNRKQKRAE
ncbi:hypothetical protein B484DRAFT_457966 [Ochromonadaceae sp. CCMP2298]|nr:hypothetical protein B484DRAFT_457966 [Ochromonadaceae sp. CCMP2298]